MEKKMLMKKIMDLYGNKGKKKKKNIEEKEELKKENKMQLINERMS